MTTVVAFGGNALSRPEDRGSFEREVERARAAIAPFVDRIRSGERMLFVHGNGPQVGYELLRSEALTAELAVVPLDACVASTQGTMGYALERALHAELGAERAVSTLVTKVRVDRADPAMRRPDKPIGPHYAKDEGERVARERGWTMVETARGVRRVVASPRPLEVIGVDAVHLLLDAGHVVIAGGGGGIAIDEAWCGVEAVVDKDHTAVLLALAVGARRIVDLTDVDAVYRDFGTERATPLARLSLEEARAMAAEGQFPPGSMGPKIEAACTFLERGGSEVLITSFDALPLALEGRAGTVLSSGASGGARRE